MKEIQDTWAKKAKEEGYRSRASFKLLQINKPHKLIENANMIIELGSAPGGWSQVISKLKKNNAKCYACLLYTSPSPRDTILSRMPSSA